MKEWQCIEHITFKDKIKLLFTPMQTKFITQEDGIYEMKWKNKKGITYLFKNKRIFILERS